MLFRSMNTDYLVIGSTPADEDCVQVCDNKPYMEEMRKECERFRDLLRDAYPPPVDEKGEKRGGLKVKSFPHDFGTYMEVVAVYDQDYPPAVDWAYELEGNTPATWDELTEIATENRSKQALEEIKKEQANARG